MQPATRMVVTHFIVSDDVERSRRFYTEVLGGTVVFGPGSTNIALANTFIIMNVGGGPTDDKPTVTLETPRDPDRVSSFLNIRVADIHAVYAEWSARGAQFLTPPKNTRTRSVATSEIPTATSSRSGKPPTKRETGGPPTGHQSTPAEQSDGYPDASDKNRTCARGLGKPLVFVLGCSAGVEGSVLHGFGCSGSTRESTCCGCARRAL